MEHKDFIFEQVINSGRFGTVYKVLYKRDSKIYAIKKINIVSAMKSMNIFNKEKALDRIKKEIRIMTLLSEPSCCKCVPCYYGYFTDDNNIYILMEYIDGLDLVDWFRKNPSNEQIFNLIKQLLEALKYIHEKNIVHSDINPNNIIINNYEIPYIIDFGISCIEKCTGYAGTSGFIAPEVIKDGLRVKSSDIWSLGKSLEYVYKGNNDSIKYIISLMLEDNYQKRQSASELLSLIDHTNINLDNSDQMMDYENNSVEDITEEVI